MAQPGRRDDRAGVRRGRHLLLGGRLPRASTRSSPPTPRSYLAHVAARAVILIQADDPVIGLVAFVPVGMSEVSSCMIGPQVSAGTHVAKGEELGYFQFGGSTHCLVFRPGVIADFTLAAIPQPHDPHAPPVLVGSRLATANSN